VPFLETNSKIFLEAPKRYEVVIKKPKIGTHWAMFRNENQLASLSRQNAKNGTFKNITQLKNHVDKCTRE
jgi:hypothetical protein